MNKSAVLVLCAGLGTRMKSEKPKVLHIFDNAPMVYHILNSVKNLGDIKVVIGYKKEIVKDEIKKWAEENRIDVKFFEQKELKGSGKAVLESQQLIKGYKDVFIVSGDVPLISKKNLLKMRKMFDDKKCDCVLLTTRLNDPKEYGRIIRDESGSIKAIVEASELSENEKNINEINSGIYLFNTGFLLKAVKTLKPKGPKKEYFLTDVVEYIYKNKGIIKDIYVDDFDEVYGPNSKFDLIELEKRYYYKNAKKHLEDGVIIKDLNLVYISKEVVIGQDSIIYPNTYILGKTKIGKNCVIGPNVILERCVIEDNCILKPFSYLTDSKIRENTVIGPFAHIRPQSDIGPNAKIGNFSEIKKSRISNGSKVPHLSYIGDTYIGKKVNIGAGSITCNYDGVKKNKTYIDDYAFIGSNTNLVAPVKIGKGVITAAGSTITIDVPDNKLVIARSREIIKEKKG